MPGVPAPPGTSASADGTRRHGGSWTALTVVELVLAVAAVLLDLFLPALVLAVLAGVSLLLRREGPGTLGFHRLHPPLRRVLELATIAVVWAALLFVLVKPLVEHVTGERQDMSQFDGLEGDLPRLLGLLALSWVLAALVEEIAFRGYLLTRITDLLGSSLAVRAGAVVAVALLFASIHGEQGFAGMALVFTDAVFYGVLRYSYRTLWAPVVAHGVVNTVGLVFYYLVGPAQALW